MCHLIGKTLLHINYGQYDSGSKKYEFPLHPFQCWCCWRYLANDRNTLIIGKHEEKKQTIGNCLFEKRRLFERCCINNWFSINSILKSTFLLFPSLPKVRQKWSDGATEDFGTTHCTASVARYPGILARPDIYNIQRNAAYACTVHYRE